MRSGEGNDEGLERFTLLASALAGRALQVAPGGPGEPAWTDGRLLFLDPDGLASERIEALVVQSSLLAAGSLETDVVRRLKGRPTLTTRYLGLEGHRALAMNEPLLPRSLRSLIDPNIAARCDSPAASLAAALTGEEIADPPPSFGAIRPRRLLGAIDRDEGMTVAGQPPSPSQRDGVLAELGEAEDADERPGTDLFSSPVGGAGALGRLLRRMLAMVRQINGGGAPGVDAPTHRMRTGRWVGGHGALSAWMAGSMEEGAIAGRATKYPEWDVDRQRYRREWCTVREVEPRSGPSASVVVSDARGLRRSLARLGMDFDSCHRQAQGDDLDIDAAIEARVAAMAGLVPGEAVYIDNLRRRRDLAVLLLLDVSGSASERSAEGGTVHEQQSAAVAALAVALHDLGDRVALYAFRSQGRSAVHVVPVKRFADDLGALAMRRLGGLVPGAYSRLGAAIRHGAAVLEDEGGTPRRLLVVLSDGLAYDHGYEPSYGAADARRALAEARRRGTGCVCLSIGASTDADALRRVFGSAAHATIPRPAQLRRVIGPLFLWALRGADVRRRLSRGERPEAMKGS